MTSMVFINLLLSTSAQAQIYKCTNFEGAVYYNDKPCPIKDREKKIKATKDVVNGYVPGISTNLSKDLKTRIETKEKNTKNNELHKSKKDVKNNKQTKKSTTNDSKQKTLDKSISDKEVSATSKSSTSKLGMNSNGASKENRRELTQEEQEILFIDMHAGEISGEEIKQ